MAVDPYNPIKSVVAVNIDGSPIAGATVYTELPTPSSFEWECIDNSAPDAGRTEDQNMHKMRIGQSVRNDVEWSYLSLADASLVLNAFDAEYVNIEIIDAKAGGWITKRFYVGNRKGSLWNSRHGKWEKISFGLIQQNADIV